MVPAGSEIIKRFYFSKIYQNIERSWQSIHRDFSEYDAEAAFPTAVGKVYTFADCLTRKRF